MFRRTLPLVLVVMIAACGKDSPSSPTPPPAATPSISMLGSLNFGDVGVGDEATRPFQIVNNGTAPLTITSITGAHVQHFSLSWTNGTIEPGRAQDVTMRFRPTSAGAFGHTLRAVGNQATGSNSLVVTANGVRTGPLWTKSGSGNTVFDMPTDISRVRIRGEWNRTQTSNFIVNIGGRNVVNEILRNSITYEGVHLTNGGGVVEIESSAQITWSFTEER